MHPKMYADVELMAEFYGMNTGEMMRKCISDFFTKIYVGDRAGRYKGVDSITNTDRRNRKENIEDIISFIQNAPPEEAMEKIREIGFITSKHEEDNGCTYIIAGEEEKRDLWMIYSPESRTSCYGSFVMLASDIRKHLKTNK